MWDCKIQRAADLRLCRIYHHSWYKCWMQRRFHQERHVNQEQPMRQAPIPHEDGDQQSGSPLNPRAEPFTPQHLSNDLPPEGSDKSALDRHSDAPGGEQSVHDEAVVSSSCQASQDTPAEANPADGPATPRSSNLRSAISSSTDSDACQGTEN